MLIDWIKPNGIEITTNSKPTTIAVCESIGWKRAEEAEKVELPSIDPDKGDGVPGSMQWHEVQVMSMDSKNEISNYVREVNGADIDKRGSLDKVKSKALAALED